MVIFIIKIDFLPSSCSCFCLFVCLFIVTVGVVSCHTEQRFSKVKLFDKKTPKNCYPCDPAPDKLTMTDGWITGDIKYYILYKYFMVRFYFCKYSLSWVKNVEYQNNLIFV